MSDAYQQMTILIEKFDATLRALAWDMVDHIFSNERAKMVKSLVEVNSPRPVEQPSFAPIIKAELDKKPTRLLRIASQLDEAEGVWSRDKGKNCYRVDGPGKESETYNLTNLTTNEQITVSLKTLANRWKKVQ